jgi:hypothetical protein
MDPARSHSGRVFKKRRSCNDDNDDKPTPALRKVPKLPIASQKKPAATKGKPSKQQTKSTNSSNRPMAKAPAVAANKKSTNVARSKKKQQQERREVEERRKAEERKAEEKKAEEAEARQHEFVKELATQRRNLRTSMKQVRVWINQSRFQ